MFSLCPDFAWAKGRRSGRLSSPRVHVGFDHLPSRPACSLSNYLSRVLERDHFDNAKRGRWPLSNRESHLVLERYFVLLGMSGRELAGTRKSRQLVRTRPWHNLTLRNGLRSVVRPSVP